MPNRKDTIIFVEFCETSYNILRIISTVWFLQYAIKDFRVCLGVFGSDILTLIQNSIEQ